MNKYREQTKNKIHSINEQLQTILDANPHAIVATDLQGVIKVFNNAAEKMFGYRAHEVIDKKNTNYFS